MSPFPYNSDGIDIEPKRKLIPEGDYDLEITKAEESVTKKDNYPCVIVEFKVIDSLTLNGKRIPFHYVVFLPKEKPGANIAVHFLKTIGQPFEKDFVVEAYKWIGKRLRARVSIEKSLDGKYENNRIKWVNPYEGAQPKEESVPF